MAVVIRRRRRKLLELRERAPTNAVIRDVIEHFLYAPRDVDAHVMAAHASSDAFGHDPFATLPEQRFRAPGLGDGGSSLIQ